MRGGSSYGCLATPVARAGPPDAGDMARPFPPPLQQQAQPQPQHQPLRHVPQFALSTSTRGARATPAAVVSAPAPPVVSSSSPLLEIAVCSSSATGAAAASAPPPPPKLVVEGHGGVLTSPLQAQLASLGLLIPSASLAGDRNPYLGGKQLDLIRTLFFRVAALERSAPASPHRAPLLFLADSRRSKQPLEPKAFPFAGERTIIFKAMHLFAICPRTNYTLHAAMTPAVPWARLVRHEAACIDRENDVHLLHISIEYDYKLAPPEQRNPVTLRCSFVRFCEPSSLSSSSSSSSLSSPSSATVAYRVGALVHELAGIEFSMAPIAPNCTHQPNKVPRNHFLCRSPELLQFPLHDRSSSSSSSSSSIPADTHTRYDIRQTIGLAFEPRSYCSTTTSATTSSTTTSSTSAPVVGATPMAIDPSSVPAARIYSQPDLDAAHSHTVDASNPLQQQQQQPPLPPSRRSQPLHLHSSMHPHYPQHHQQPNSPHFPPHPSMFPMPASPADFIRGDYRAAALSRRHSVAMMTPSALASLLPFDLRSEQCGSPGIYSSLPSYSSRPSASPSSNRTSPPTSSQSDNDDDDYGNWDSWDAARASGSSTDSGSDDGTPLSLSPSSSCSSSSSSTLSLRSSNSASSPPTATAASAAVVARTKSAKRRVLSYHPYRAQPATPPHQPRTSPSHRSPNTVERNEPLPRQTAPPSPLSEMPRPPPSTTAACNAPNPKSSIESLLNHHQPAHSHSHFRSHYSSRSASHAPAEPLMSEWDASALLLSLTGDR